MSVKFCFFLSKENKKRPSPVVVGRGCYDAMHLVRLRLASTSGRYFHRKQTIINFIGAPRSPTYESKLRSNHLHTRFSESSHLRRRSRWKHVSSLPTLVPPYKASASKTCIDPRKV